MGIIKIKEELSMADGKKYVCTICGYVYDGPDFNAEPEDYLCPVCGVGKDMFEVEE